jgi:hypothetical protein
VRDDECPTWTDGVADGDLVADVERGGRFVEKRDILGLWAGDGDEGAKYWCTCSLS